MSDRQDASDDRVVCGGLPAETASEIRHHGRIGQRVGGSQAPTAIAGVLARWARDELIAIDEVGYVPLAEVGAEFLFQVIAERAEKAAIMTTNLPFSEWTQVIPNARLCKALLDRITDRAHIIETGSDSYRFRRMMEKRQKRKA
jgi:IstB-like ATP binding protein